MTSNSEIRSIIDDYRRLTNRLEHLLLEDSLVLGDDGGFEKPVFDPDLDEPGERPDVGGSRSQRDWCGLMLWAQLRAINVRQGRGASIDEIVEIAKNAGYNDGRGWNRWTGWEEGGDGRKVTSVGMQHLRVYYERVGRSLPADLL